MLSSPAEQSSRPPHRWSRRTVLKSVGSILPLPLLPSLQHRAFSAERTAVPKRFFCVHFSYGVRPEHWWPADSNDPEAWKRTASLSPLARHADKLTLLKGVSLVRGTTHGVHGQPNQFLNGDQISKVSMDQILAADLRFGGASRYPSIETGGKEMPEGLAFTHEGVPLPAINDAQLLFQLLFADDKTDPQVVMHRLSERRSMLDALQSDIHDVERKLNLDDRRKLDEYLSSVRQIERKIEKTEEWLFQPKPRPTIVEPTETPSVEHADELADLFFDLLLAAFETDQTRVASFFFGNSKIATPGGAAANYHSFTHHNGDKNKLAALAAADRVRNQAFAKLLETMSDRREADGSSMLDNTLILYGSATEDASTHRGISLPLVIAGRPDLFKHRGMVEFPAKLRGMSEVLLTLLQAQGIEQESFGEASSILSELLV